MSRPRAATGPMRIECWPRARSGLIAEVRASAKGLDRSVAVSVRVHRTDKVDTQILAQLLATDFLSGGWLADERTQMLRRVTMRRAHLMRQCIHAKNQIHSVLHRNLLPARL